MKRALCLTALVVFPAFLMGGCEATCQSDEPKVVVDRPVASSDDGDVKVTIKETPK